MKSYKMMIYDYELDILHQKYDETGMGFLVAQTQQGPLIINSDASALPCYSHQVFYDINDYLAGDPWPTLYDSVHPTVSNIYSSRDQAIAALSVAGISSKFTGNSGALPLIGGDTLKSNTKFIRRLSASTDRRYQSGSLASGTYLTTILDNTYANTGFAAVGRFALPMPLPASYYIEYELPAGTKIDIGTVAPLFGQSGGGVEIHLSLTTPAVVLGSGSIDDF